MSVLDPIRTSLVKPLKPGELMGWIRFVIFVGLLAIGYAQLYGRVGDLQRQTTRIERYISSKDPMYWQSSRSMTDP